MSVYTIFIANVMNKYMIWNFAKRLVLAALQSFHRLA